MTINTDILEASRTWLPVLFSNVSPYELGLLSTLLASDKPMRARRLNALSGIPRTKIYNTLKRLVEAGLAEEVIMTAEEFNPPDIWEFWPERRRNMYRKSKEVSVQKWRAKKDVILEKFMLFQQEFQSLCRYIGLLEVEG